MRNVYVLKLKAKHKDYGTFEERLGIVLSIHKSRKSAERSMDRYMIEHEDDPELEGREWDFAIQRINVEDEWIH